MGWTPETRVGTTVDLKLCAAIEGVEAASARSFYDLAPAEIRRRLHPEYSIIGGATVLAAPGSQHRSLNRVIGLGLAEPASERVLNQIEGFYESRGMSRYAIALSPLAQPADLPQMLLARGLRAKAGAAKLVRGGVPLESKAPALPIREVDRGHADEWFELMSGIFRHFRTRGAWFKARFGAEGWRHFAAFDSKRIVAVGALYTGAWAAHLVEGATLTPFRKRGLQRALIEVRVRAALGNGVRVLTSETAPPLPRMPLVSFRNLQRVGFELAYQRPTYLWGE